MCVSLLVATAVCWLGPPPSSLEPLGRFDPHLLPEASGIIKSRRHPGIFWTHNDSGNSPTLFAIRRDGTIVRAFRLSVPNVDWEDIATDDQGHLYLGDIGNNGGVLAVRGIYRIDEPDPTRPAAEPPSVRASTFYRFSGGDRFDAEGLVYDPGTGCAIVVAKRFDGREAELFNVPFQPPAPLLRPAIPRQIGALPRFVEPATGASLSTDLRLLAVCSYCVTRIYERRRDKDHPWALLAEVQYPSRAIEGICWDGEDLILVSEGQGVDRIAAATWKRLARALPPAGRARSAAASDSE
jgi:hypothetical protein